MLHVVLVWSGSIPRCDDIEARPGPTKLSAPNGDLQAWIRNEDLAPDWLRAGTDIVGGTDAPKFNASFSLNGDTVPEPASLTLLASGLLVGGWRSLKTKRRSRRS
jgi:PEP-CTERM motif